MASFVKFQQFVEDLAHKIHDLETDQLVVALTNAANPPSASADAVLGDLTQISYTNLSNRNLTTSSSGQTSGTYKLVIADLILSASGGTVGPFQYVVIYNDTAATDELIGYYDRGSEYTIPDGESFTLDFDGTNGMIDLV